MYYSPRFSAENLRPATVDDARKSYRSGIPLKCWIGQTFDGLIDEKKPSVNSLDHLEDVYFTGHLVIDDKVTIPNWLNNCNSGPYYPDVVDNRFYYLPCVLAGERVQICSNPLNVISEDCLDEVNLWVLE